MEYAQCNNCGDKLFFTKTRELKHCTCKTISIDWSLYAQGHRVIGNKKDYVMGED